MITTFEEPAKTELRAACAVALDQAGYEVTPTLSRHPLPGGLQGALEGDLQSLDGQDQRTFYYLRITMDDALPKWLANIARASHVVRAGEVYVVVRDFKPSLKTSCAGAGAGLLVITEDNKLEVVLRYAEVAPIDVEAVLAIRLDKMRRSMERKLDLAQTEIKSRHHLVSQLVSDMEPEAGDKYIRKLESEYRVAEDWADEVARRLDAITSETPSAEVDALEAMIARGPRVEEDEAA